MFKDSNVFDFTNFPFKTKYKNTVDYSVNSNYLFTREKQEKNVETIILNLLSLFINIPPIVLFHWRIKTWVVLIHQ